MPSLNFTNLRVFISEKDHSIYDELTNRAMDKAEDIPFTKMPDLFVIAACIGVKNNKYKELDKKKRDIFVADAFNQAVHIPILAALAFYFSNDIEILSDPKEVLNICECYANGGIKILYEQLLIGSGLRPLYRLIDYINNEKNNT